MVTLTVHDVLCARKAIRSSLRSTGLLSFELPGTLSETVTYVSRICSDPTP